MPVWARSFKFEAAEGMGSAGRVGLCRSNVPNKPQTNSSELEKSLLVDSFCYQLPVRERSFYHTSSRTSR